MQDDGIKEAVHQQSQSKHRQKGIDAVHPTHVEIPEDKDRDRYLVKKTRSDAPQYDHRLKMMHIPDKLCAPREDGEKKARSRKRNSSHCRSSLQTQKYRWVSCRAWVCFKGGMNGAISLPIAAQRSFACLQAYSTGCIGIVARTLPHNEYGPPLLILDAHECV